MTRSRTAALILTVALAVTTPTLTYAATQPRNESRDTFRADRDSLLARAVRSVKQLILRALAEPQSPPPTVH